MLIVDLRQLNSRQIEPLLVDEAKHWRDELRWDYRTSLELIKKFVDAKSLAGCAAMEDNQAIGYAFYVMEEHKGLLGGLYVSPRYPQLEVAQKLLGLILETLRAIPRIERIEAQLVPFGCSFDQALSIHGFRLYPRQFMLLEFGLGDPAGADSKSETEGTGAHPTLGLSLERWDDRYFAPCARLIQLAYANHMDGEINDQYRSESGALKFLKNIIILPGCGQFQPQASFVLRAPHSHELLGVVLTSAVAPGVGHTTQICVMPGYQGHGLGKRLIKATIAALRKRNFTALSLTVTAANLKAVRLYEQIGFQRIKTFTAGVWHPAGSFAADYATSGSARATDPSTQP
jgi:ribosomal protein S18 acetylase RimI-like enzyme